MNVIETELPGVLIIEPDVFEDGRGYFMETWSRRRYEEAGIASGFVQDNAVFSTRGVLRGLHFQNPSQQGKLVYVLSGEVFDVAVDIRLGSPTFGRWVGVVLSGSNRRQLYIPEGFAHGYCVTGDSSLFMYKCTDGYNPGAEHSVLWSDPNIGIQWPADEPVVSKKDEAAPLLKDIPREHLPVYR